MAHIRKRARPPDNWLSALLDYLLAWTLAGARWLARQAQPLLWSPTGYANPRVAHLRGALGYHLHSYEVALTSVERWQNGQDELFPAVLQVQTINRCNAACAMCPYPYTIHRQPRELMDDALFSKIVQECTVEPGLLDFVPMAKNEPLLDPRLDTRIQEFRAAALPHQMVELVTNGSTLSAERFRRLAASGVDLITISLNAASAETYRLVMGGVSWQRIMRNLEEISQVDRSQVNLYLRFVKQRDNQNDYRTFVRQWGRRGFNLMAYEVNNRA
nr:radical SAM protein [Caldilineaceae bacterium]